MLVSLFKQSRLSLTPILLGLGVLLSSTADANPYAVKEPKFVAAIDSKLAHSDIIFGLKFRGKTKAYPLKILRWHSEVHDQLAGEPVKLIYIPACGGRMVGRDTPIASCEDLIATASFAPIQQTTWADWQAEHSDSEVLSEETGFWRDYSVNPYPQEHEWLVGVVVNGQAKAYPHVALGKYRSTIEDQIGTQKLTIEWDPRSRIAIILDDKNQPVDAIVAVKDAWFKVHPKSATFTF